MAGPWERCGQSGNFYFCLLVFFPPGFIFSEWQIFGYWKEDILNSHVNFKKRLKSFETLSPLPHNYLEAITLAMGTNMARYHILHGESFKETYKTGGGNRILSGELESLIGSKCFACFCAFPSELPKLLFCMIF